MPSRPGRGRQGSEAARLPGTNSRPTTDQTAAQIISETFSQGSASTLDFMQGSTGGTRAAFRSSERRRFLEETIYVNQWRNWMDPEGRVQRIDYGMFFFLRDCCRTFIEAKKNQETDQGSPIRSLPQPNGTGDTYFDALCYVGALWQTQDILAISKSRRLIMSWFLRCADLWDILYHPGRELAVRADDLDDSEAMIYRNVFGYEHIPNDCVPRNCLPPIQTVSSASKSNTDKQFNRITIRHSEHEPGQMDSFIQAVSKNSDQRGAGYGRIVIEEAPKQRDLRKYWAGLMGTRIGESGTLDGGQIVLVGTPVLESFMDYLIHEKDLDKR